MGEECPQMSGFSKPPEDTPCCKVKLGLGLWNRGDVRFPQAWTVSQIASFVTLFTTISCGAAPPGAQRPLPASRPSNAGLPMSQFLVGTVLAVRVFFPCASWWGECVRTVNSEAVKFER